MTRSPLFYPLNRGGDAEAGGAADLQTDVMRFMAILSLCLVAIFALVQSIPLTPSEEQQPTTAEAPVVPETMDQSPATDESEPVVARVQTAIKLTRPTPAKMPVRDERVALQRPTPKPVVRQSAPAPVEAVTEPTVAPTEPVKKGFTLRFETDAALTRLVARQIVGLYAMSSEKSLRMNVDGDKINFWPASVPGKFHEMDISTVPDTVLAAYPEKPDADVKWGVTLPADMSRKLDNYLTSASGGSLIIASNGEIDLRR